jgi:putative hydrolase
MSNPKTFYQYIGDLHTHTSVSQHAYSSVHELVSAAQQAGLLALGITNHGPALFDGAIEHHFICIKDLPIEVNGVLLLRGAEANIVDYRGTLDLSKRVLAPLDFVIGSYHIEVISPSTALDHTKGWIKTIEGGSVDCLGHCGNPAYPFDHEEVVKACAAHGVAIEVNNNSFFVRKGSEVNCKHVVELCLKHQVPIIVNSDAHSMYRVGLFTDADAMLYSMGVGEQHILNTSLERIRTFIQNRKVVREGVQ